MWWKRDDIDRKRPLRIEERLCPSKMGILTPEERKDNFKEIVAGYPPARAEYEGSRCWNAAVANR